MKSGSFPATTSNDTIFGNVTWSSYVVEGTNTSNVTATLTLRKHYLYGVTQITKGTGTWQLSINNVVYELEAYKEFNFVSDTVVISNEVTVTHNSDGTKTCAIEVTGGIPNKSYTRTDAKGSAVLDTIIVPATILTAPNFTDIENPTITFSNPRNYPVQFKIEDINNPSDLIFTSKLSNYVGDSYTFNLTTNQRNTLRTASQNYTDFPIRFTVSSYIPSSSSNPTYWSWLDRTMTVVTSAPIFSTFTHENVESETLALTGDSSVYVQNVSQCQVTIPVANKMVAQKGATPSWYSANIGNRVDKKSYSANADVVFDPITVVDYYPTISAIVIAYDSRKKNTIVSQPMNVIPYVPNGGILQATCSNRVTSDGKIIISDVKGKYYPIVVGGVEKNEVDVVCSYQAEDEIIWHNIDMTLKSLANGLFEFDDIQITGLDVTKKYIVEFSAGDFYDQIGEDITKIVAPAIDIVTIKVDGRVCINTIPTGNEKGLHISTTDSLFNYFYPVGSCYSVRCYLDLQTNTYLPVVDPNDFLGDMTWSQTYTLYDDDDNPYIFIYERSD